MVEVTWLIVPFWQLRVDFRRRGWWPGATGVPQKPAATAAGRHLSCGPIAATDVNENERPPCGGFSKVVSRLRSRRRQTIDRAKSDRGGATVLDCNPRSWKKHA